MRPLAPLLAVASLSLSPPARAQQVEILRQSGDSKNRINLAILGDGYRAAEQSKLSADAKALANQLFAMSPYKEYAGLFNVKLVHVVSNENGADRGSYGASRDTALGARFFCFNVERLLCVDADEVVRVAARTVPEYDVAMVIVNDPMYGGSGGTVVVSSTEEHSGEIVRHELGHVLGNLADEYTDPYPGYANCDPQEDCPEPNATLRTSRSDVKWNAWIDSGTPVPTPSQSGRTGIGVFEGCRYQSRGVYRPKDECLMGTFGDLGFCSVCAEAMVRSFWKNPSPIDSATPRSPVKSEACAALTFSVTHPAVSPAAWARLWTVDDSPVKSAAGSTLTLSPGTLKAGRHAVAVAVQDQTPFVRNDPDRLLRETHSWTVDVSDDGKVCVPCNCAPGPCEESSTCDGKGGCQSTPKPAGALCAEASCQDGSKTEAATCDGAGRCVAPQSLSCNGFGCDTKGACKTVCASDADCASGSSCNTGSCEGSAEELARTVVSCASGCSAAGDSTTGFLSMVFLDALVFIRQRRARRKEA